MKTTVLSPPISLAQFLVMERESPVKLQFINGIITEMPGASLIHSLLTASLVFLLKSATKGKNYTVLSSDIKIFVPEQDGIYYADLTIVQGKPQLLDEQHDTLLNPCLVVEVLSPSTQKYDRIDKLEGYRRIPSLQQYWMVSQNKPKIEQYIRLESGDWLLHDVIGFDQIIHFEGDISMAAIYEGVEFV